MNMKQSKNKYTSILCNFAFDYKVVVISSLFAKFFYEVC